MIVDEFIAEALYTDQHGPSAWRNLTDLGRQYYIDRYNSAIKRAAQNRGRTCIEKLI